MNICRLCLGEGIGYPSIYTERSYVQKLVHQMEGVVGVKVNLTLEIPTGWYIFSY